MSDLAIRVDNLSKRYRIGHGARAPYKTLRESLMGTLAAPVNRLRTGQQQSNKKDHIWALKDVSFEIDHGEVVGIIGRNGAGKTTLLKILSRITEPTSGSADLYGRVGSLLEVGTGFHPELTGRENIFLNGAILGMHRIEIERKFDEIVDFAEIEKFIDTPVKFYSSGMYVRLAFAVAAHLEPEILLVDEVLAVGDVAFQKKCLGKMSDVAKEGRTVLFVSHNMGAIQRLCPYSILLNNGKVSVYDVTLRVINNYLSTKSYQSMNNEYINFHRTGDLGRKARVSSLRLYNSKGDSTTSFAFGEPIKIKIECIVYEKIEDVSFLIGFDSLYDERIASITSLEDGKTFSASPEDKIVGNLEINNFLLKPGRYSITLGLFSTNMGIDRIANVTDFEIDDVSFGGHIHVSQVNVGFIQVPFPDWRIEKCV